MIKTDVIIIGGGATGCGIARDLALRGIPHCLIEKGDFAAGALTAGGGKLADAAVGHDPSETAVLVGDEDAKPLADDALLEHRQLATR